MPSISQNISPFGPLIDLIIEVSQPRQQALEKAGKPIPTGVTARLLIDTGASCTSIDSSVFSALALNPTGTIDIHTPSTGAVPVQQNQYDVRLIIPHISINRYFHAVPVVEANFQAQGIQGLLGRDILRECVFIYNGEIGVYTLSF